MQTFKQYVNSKRTIARHKYGITAAEACAELPESAYWQEWRDYVVSSFNAGEDIPTRLWNTLDEGLQYRVKRTPRSLQRVSHDLI